MGSSYYYLILNAISLTWLVVALICIQTLMAPFHRGFTCGDDSINKPYVKNETLPFNKVLVVIVLLLNLAVISCELLRYLIARHCGNTDREKNQLKKWILRVMNNILLAFTGLGICVIIVGIAKNMVGELRPHFIAACEPDYSKFNCSDGYITFDVCKQTDKNIVNEARLSFPSGHSTCSFYTGIFIALYIEYTVVIKHINLFKVCIQLLLICFALAVSLTRIMDYYHHWSDVLAGGLLGIIVAFFTIFYILKLPSRDCQLIHQHVNKCDDEQNRDDDIIEAQRLLSDSRTD